MSPDRNDQDRIGYGRGDVDRASETVRSRSSLRPEVALILGSGLGSLVEGFSDPATVSYEDVPGFPPTTVGGHSGRLVMGRVAGVPTIAQDGRIHLYEGYSASTVAFPLRVMQALGATTLVITNVAGGINHHFEPGDVMLIEDHVNFQFRSPLRGRGPLVDQDRFVDLSEPYSRRLLDLARKTLLESAVSGIQAGTYFGVLGPSYETPAEIRMIRKLGGDAVGMSTVPEVITARHLGMEVLGICCISNLAAGLGGAPLSHEDVIRGAQATAEKLKSILTALLPRINEPK